MPKSWQDIPGKNRKIVIIGAYAPNEDEKKTIRDEFYEKIVPSSSIHNF